MPDKRRRRSRDEIVELRVQLVALIEQHRPLTVRHLFYLAVAAGLIQKTEDEYQNVVIRLTGQMREEWLRWREDEDCRPRPSDVIPFGSGYVVDAGRWIHKPRSYVGIEAALRNTADFYRRDLWAHADDFVAVFCEKDAIADLAYQETAQWDVPLAVIRGFSSKTFLWENAQAIDAADKDADLYFLGDHDEAGDGIIKTAVESIRRYARTQHKIRWEKIAVTPEQIDQFNLPTRPSKTAGARYVDGCVEVDAIPPETLRELIREAIVPHIDVAALRVIETAEKSERELMQRIAGNLPAIRRTLGTA